MKRLGEQANELAQLAHRFMMTVAASEGLYLVVVFLLEGVLSADVFMTKKQFLDPLREYVIRPWAGVLLGLYLARKKPGAGGKENWMLVLLMLWFVVPFVMRFGTVFFTVYPWANFATCFFVVYASVCESDRARRERQLDIFCAGVGLISVVLGSALLYCAATGKVYYAYYDNEYFGVVNGQLQHAMHYNSTGMLTLCCEMICLTGFCRSRKKAPAVFYLIGMVQMALVVVLTQSRTARYAMLIAYAVGAWNVMCGRLQGKKAVWRQAAALLCSAAVLVGGYHLSRRITDAALAYYAGLAANEPVQLADMIAAPAIAENQLQEIQELQEMQEMHESIRLNARASLDSTFSDRTNIWKNIFRNWKNNPRHMFIGNGAYRTSWLIADNTIHEAIGSASAHNAYLQFAADYGVAAFAMLAAAFVLIFGRVWRAFSAHGEKQMAGGCALGMLVIAVLATGMMENSPLDPMTPINVALFFALAQLAGAGRDMMKNDKEQTKD